MDNDSPLVPRNRANSGAIPVQASRAGHSINIPDGRTNPFDPPPPAPVQPYVVIINPPSAASPPAPITQQPPAQNHYTTHVHHYARRGASRGGGHSVLGMASLALGIIACVLCWMPILGLAAVPIGLIGALLGVFGLLLSALFRKSSVALPAGGIFVCILAAAISIASTGSLIYWQQQLHKAIPQVVSAPVVNSQTKTATGTVPGKSSSAPPVDPKVRSASEQLNSAVETATHRFLQSDAYQQAAAQLAAARDRAAQLRIDSPNSNALKQADQLMIDLNNALTGLKESAVRSDPDVITAQQQLSAARHPSTTPLTHNPGQSVRAPPRLRRAPKLSHRTAHQSLLPPAIIPECSQPARD